MHKSRHLSTALLLFSLWGCGGEQPELKAKEYKGRFEDKVQGISFTCPEKWEVRENIHGQRVIARSPLEAAQDGFQENLVVTGPILSADLSSAFEKVGSDLQSQLKDFKEHARSTSQLDFSHKLEGQTLKARSYLLAGAQEQQFWLYTFTSTDSEFARWEKPFQAIAATFRQPLVSSTPTPTPAASATPEASPRPLSTLTPGPPASSPTPQGSATPLARPQGP